MPVPKIKEHLTSGTEAPPVPVERQHHRLVILVQRQMLCQSVKPVHIPGLIKQNLHSRILHDGILDDRGGDYILQLLCHHHCRSPVLTCSLPQLHHICGHLSTHYRFPGFLDTHHLEVPVRGHLLGKGIHNHKRSDRINHRITLDVIDLKHHKPVIQNICIIV